MSAKLNEMKWKKKKKKNKREIEKEKKNLELLLNRFESLQLDFTAMVQLNW